MSTDLRRALREAVDDAPAYSVDADAVIAAGRRQIRRRATLAVGSCALAAAALVVAVALPGQERPAPDPAPAEIHHLDLDDSVAVDLDVVASTRTAWDNDYDSLEYDRLVGITVDGLVLRDRYSNARGEVELGLLDPRTGSTDWLPTPPGRPFEAVPLDLTTERLVLAHAAGNGHSVLSFDRGTRTWQRDVVRVPYGIEVHAPPHLVMSPEGRVYIGSTMEGESGPLHWWSAPAPGGGEARPEPALEDTTVAWGDGVRISAEPSGRIVVSDAVGGARVMVEDRPEACERPERFPDAPVTVLVAGGRPVATYQCESGTDLTLPRTVVYEEGGQRVLDIAGASALAADDRHVVLAGTSSLDPSATEHPEHGSTYLLDLEALTISRVGESPYEPQVALVNGLLLWNTPGPGDSQDIYDVTWKVARID